MQNINFHDVEFPWKQHEEGVPYNIKSFIWPQRPHSNNVNAMHLGWPLKV